MQFTLSVESLHEKFEYIRWPQTWDNFKKNLEVVCNEVPNVNFNMVYNALNSEEICYTIEYLFTVDEHVFNPPPKVKSAVIRLVRNERTSLGCDEKLFKQVVKQGFNNRRKTLRNALKPMNLPIEFTQDQQLDLRAEQLSVEDFIILTNKIEEAYRQYPS